MAAPHVTGAAGLLFSLKPSATVEEVRNALLAGVDAVPSLSGQTTSGGRLDVAKAMDSLEGSAVDVTPPAEPVLTGTVPESGSNDNHPRITGSAEAGSTVIIFKGGTVCNGPVTATGTAAQLASAGIEVAVPDNSISLFSARAIDAARNESPCSSPTSYLEDSPEEEEKEFEVIREEQITPAPIPVAPVAQVPTEFQAPRIQSATCTVPKLIGKTLGKAKSALSAAHCRVGKVRKPRANHGRKLGALVVVSSLPGQGAMPANGSVDLTLGHGHRPKHHHHR